MSGDGQVTRRLEALIQAGMTLASERSLPAVLQKIIDLACEVADARYGALGVIGPDGRIAEFITHGVTDEERARIGALPEGHGILGVLIKEGKPLRLERIQDHPASYGFPPHHPPMTSFLGVPLEVRGQIFGNLYLTEKIGADRFTVEDEQAVGTLAVQAGIAVENARLYQEQRANQLRLAATNQVTEAILERRPINEVLRLIAGYARELVGAATSTIATPEPGAEELFLCVADGARADELRGVRFPLEGSVSGEVLRARRGMLIEDASSLESQHQPLVRLGTFGPAMLVPLGMSGTTFGTLAVANERGGRRFTHADLSLVQLFASQAAIALEYGRVREELERVAVIEDRERIAKELHDGVVQSLFAVGMSLQALDSMAEDPAEVRKRIGSAVDDIDRSIRDLRNYIFSLRPGELADWQLVRSLEELADDFGGGSVSVHVHVDRHAAARLAARAFDVIQAAREALSNAVRHSGGTTVSLSLTSTPTGSEIEVADDGRGFDPSAPTGGHGLGNMRARAEALGGALSVDAAEGRGTTVKITIPL